MSMSQRQTLEQRYATKVYAKANAYSGESKDIRTRYGNLAFTLPIMIRSAGLVQALHFASTRKKAEQKQFLEDLADVLGYQNTQELLDQSRTAQITEYMRLTRQTLAVLVWFKRFAQSILDLEASEATESDSGENNA
ncbi:type III-B CRISPR module-associated protein Cmr5 [Herpetosiphon sp.]|uniref:CRISPR type III-B/RAMP module-associated protein Cmr5 n=1 Tax=Herpetosiphon aurantiacus (strain ATCC 23779 / DSM 785 / 114-95) TaxID=316274 RepID=A9AVY5_HERA2|nr:type III-B CRISPR module-associated protein Cmr5 [Herpetosiphon sp.]ABX03223.1 CRISPR-associated protein, Cmr5 family [Herpetosiphon aurantiacus DSM 785]